MPSYFYTIEKSNIVSVKSKKAECQKRDFKKSFLSRYGSKILHEGDIARSGKQFWRVKL